VQNFNEGKKEEYMERKKFVVREYQVADA
jgi:hypothetical protein